MCGVTAKKSQEEDYRVFTPQYTHTNTIVKHLTTIERLKAKIEQARILPHDEIRLRKEAIVSMVHHSTAIHLGDTYEERKSADMTDWLAYFTGGFKVALEAALKKVDAFALSPKVKPKEQLYLDKNERLVVDFLISHGKLYRQDVKTLQVFWKALPCGC